MIRNLLQCLFLFFYFVVEGKAGEQGFKLDYRIRPYSGDSSAIFLVKNNTDSTVLIDDFNIRGNGYGIQYLKSVDREWLWSSLGEYLAPGSTHTIVTVLPKMTHRWEFLLSDDLFDHGLTVRGYELYVWKVRVISDNPQFFSSQTICLGFPDKDDQLILPVINLHGSLPQLYIAFIFRMQKLPELGFLLLNGSDEIVTIDKPLTRASCIVATAPTIGYTNELHIAGQAPERISVDPGKVGEWRIPWPTIHGLIPADDLTAIKAAGGDLDLVWRAGAYQSDPLPLSLAPPVTGEAAADGGGKREVGR